MAGRFVFQKFASGMSRSTARLSAHASPSARTNAPVISRAPGARNLSEVFHGSAVHPGMVFPNIHAYAARYLSTFPYSNASNATAKTGHIINQQKSGFVDSVGGVKPTCSSSASNKLKHYLGTKLADWRARFPRLRPNEIIGTDDLGGFVVNVVLLCAFSTCLIPWTTDQCRIGNKGHCSGCKCLSGPSKS